MREHGFGFGILPDSLVQALDNIGCIDDFPDFQWIIEELGKLFPDKVSERVTELVDHADLGDCIREYTFDRVFKAVQVIRTGKSNIPY